jgi:hypothetical protein
MKTLLINFFLFLSLTLCAQEAAQWDGYFEGTLIGIQSTLTGKTTGSQWTALIDAQGYPLHLEGTISGRQCSGNITDPQNNSTLPFKATHSGIEITISVRDENPITGVMEDMEFIFVKGTPPSEQATTQSSIQSSAPPTPAVSVDASKLDQTVVGLWRYTDTYVSGEFSFATDYFMQFFANGVVYITDGRTAGGGPTSSIDSGDGDVHQGTWKTENKVLWLHDGTNGWQNYARYYAEGNSMMLTYANGFKQVWERL